MCLTRFIVTYTLCLTTSHDVLLDTKRFTHCLYSCELYHVYCKLRSWTGCWPSSRWQAVECRCSDLPHDHHAELPRLEGQGGRYREAGCSDSLNAALRMVITSPFSALLLQKFFPSFLLPLSLLSLLSPSPSFPTLFLLSLLLLYRNLHVTCTFQFPFMQGMEVFLPLCTLPPKTAGICVKHNAHCW